MANLHPQLIADNSQLSSMRFFSKITFICNLCFIAAVILRKVEMTNKTKGDLTGAIKLQPLESTLVVLGYSAIIVNFIFNIACFLFFLSKKALPVGKWMIWFNFLLLLTQLFYFFC